MAVTVDDHSQNISLVSRGNDLFYVTPIHVLLQKLFNFQIPNFFHHRLIIDKKGKKLSKTKKSVSLNQLRMEGISLDEIKSMLDI
ncbi:MAG: glutamate--tRNA ligase family protein [Paracoccaceae bacterium]